jgi:hypothetical protein
MKRERLNQRFSGGADSGLVIPADGSEPRRLDGKPLTDYDRQLLAGRDPIAEQIQELENKKGA